MIACWSNRLWWDQEVGTMSKTVAGMSGQAVGSSPGGNPTDGHLLDSYLKELRLPTFVEHWRSFSEDAAQSNLNYKRFLLALAQQEVTQREQNRKERRIKAARFPAIKELADFHFSAIPSLSKAKVLQLAQGEYIQKAESILMLGNPGLGKTHLAISLGLEACRQGYKTRFYNAAGLVNELLQAQDEHRVNKFLTSVLKYHLIILDELGFIPFSSKGAHLIFQFCSTLYERVAMIVTSNLSFADWTQVFGDERLTLALLDRLTHRAHILELVGDSFRFRQRMQRAQGEQAGEAEATKSELEVEDEKQEEGEE
jgi:DNA replication protein DnaC